MQRERKSRRKKRSFNSTSEYKNSSYMCSWSVEICITTTGLWMSITWPKNQVKFKQKIEGHEEGQRPHSKRLNHLVENREEQFTMNVVAHDHPCCSQPQTCRLVPHMRLFAIHLVHSPRVHLSWEHPESPNKQQITLSNLTLISSRLESWSF